MTFFSTFGTSKSSFSLALLNLTSLCLRCLREQGRRARVARVFVAVVVSLGALVLPASQARFLVSALVPYLVRSSVDGVICNYLYPERVAPLRPRFHGLGWMLSLRLCLSFFQGLNPICFTVLAFISPNFAFHSFSLCALLLFVSTDFLIVLKATSKSFAQIGTMIAPSSVGSITGL